MDAITKISKARTQLLLNRRYVFWATIGMYQQLVENNGPENPTMATDGEHLYWNRTFVESLQNDELMFVLAHEAGHCALGHHLRRQTRHVFGWNIAADFALNQMLVDTGLTPPRCQKCNATGQVEDDKKKKHECPVCKGAKTPIMLDPQFKDMNTELIYTKIKFTESPNGQGNGQGQSGQGQPGNQSWPGDFGGCGSVMDSVLVSSKDEEGVRKWEIITRQAAQVAKSQGHLPGAFEYLIEPIKPKVDFNSVLRHLISVAQEDDYSWRKPSRKHVWAGMYLPTLYTESVGDIVVGVDVSGSISGEMASKFLGAVNIVLTEFKPRNLHLILLDAAVQSHETYVKGDLLPEKVKIKGGGGTDMRPIWKYLKEKSIEPVCAIMFSDFYMGKEDFGKPQDFRVLWVTCSRDMGDAPWGITVKMS